MAQYSVDSEGVIILSDDDDIDMIFLSDDEEDVPSASPSSARLDNVQAA